MDGESPLLSKYKETKTKKTEKKKEKKSRSRGKEFWALHYRRCIGEEEDEEDDDDDDDAALNFSLPSPPTHYLSLYVQDEIFFLKIGGSKEKKLTCRSDWSTGSHSDGKLSGNDDCCDVSSSQEEGRRTVSTWFSRWTTPPRQSLLANRPGMHAIHSLRHRWHSKQLLRKHSYICLFFSPPSPLFSTLDFSICKSFSYPMSHFSG